MAIQVRDLRLWLAEFDLDDEIAIDDVALVSVADPEGYYIEIGGLPQYEPEE